MTNVNANVSTNETSQKETLALYYFPGCPFCTMVTSVIQRLGVDIELRNINQVAEYREELLNARGRGTVPVLKIISAYNEQQWMPESSDIVNYLQQKFA